MSPRAWPRVMTAGPAVLAVAALLACRAPPPSDVSDLTELKPGQPVRRPLGIGDGHGHRITAAVGDFLAVEVEQRGIDVAVTLSDPDGEVIVQVDRPNVDVGPERVLALVDTAGELVLRIASASSRKIAPDAGYQAQVVALRPATARDRRAARAALLFHRGERAFGDGDPGRAIELFERAGALWRGLGDLWWQGECLNRAGRARESLGAWQAAAETHLEAAEVFRRLGDDHWHGIEQLWAGRGRFHHGDLVAAEARYRAARGRIRAAGDRWNEAFTLHNLGHVYQVQGKAQASLEHYRGALDLWRDLENRREQGMVHHNLGTLRRSLGEAERARFHFGRAERSFVEIGNRSLEAMTVNQLGRLHRERGDLSESLAALERALALRQEPGRPRAASLSELGRTLHALGRHAEAREHYEESAAILERLEQPRSRAKVLRYLGLLLLETHPAGALERLRRAAAIDRDVGEPASEAASLLGIARAERRLGRPEAAIEALEGALELAESLRLSLLERRARGAFFATAQPIFDQLIDLEMARHDEAPEAGHDIRALELGERARARSLLDLLAEAGVDLRAGVEPAELLVRERDLEVRLDQRQRLADLAEAGGGLRSAVTARRTMLDRQLDGLLAELEAVRAEIRARSPAYAGLTQPQTAGLAAMRSLLDDETVLLSFRLGGTRSFVWAVTPTSVRSAELANRSVLEAIAREAHESVAASHRPHGRSAARQVLCALSAHLLEPIEQALHGRRLLIVPDGALEYVPFAAIADPATACDQAPPLVERFEIVVLPSASALVLQRRLLTGRARPAGELAVIADPVLEAADRRIQDAAAAPAAVPVAQLERLAYAHQEAKAIHALASPGGGSLLALGFDATKALVMSGRLADFRFVHFATHGLLDTERPQLSRLALARLDAQGRSLGGDLYLHEVFHLELGAELVTLSACETALGQEIRGEGLWGLTRGFFYAGAERVLVSLWPVQDQGTAELMTRLYRRMLVDERSPAAALRAAQRSLRRLPEWSAPYYWAGFVLQGEWR